MSPALGIKTAFVLILLALFLSGWLRRNGEVELNHLVAALFVTLVPTAFFLPERYVTLAPSWLALYFALYFVSVTVLLSGPIPRRPLESPLIRRLADQFGRVLNEEVLFRGLFFLVPYHLWGQGSDWLLWAFPQAFVFALLHALPVYFSLRGHGRFLRSVLGGFAFPFVGALTFAYLCVASGGLIPAVLLHYLTNFAAELGFELMGWRIEFTVGEGNLSPSVRA